MNDDRLTSDVRRALSAGALAADPGLVDVDAVHAGIRSRRRRRLAALSSAAVVALVAAGAALALQRPGDAPGTARVLTDPTPTPTATATADGRVPWLALPPSTAVPTPIGSPPVPTARECDRGDVSFVEREDDGAAGTLYSAFLVKNTGTSTCTLSGSPGVSVSGTGGGGDVRHDAGIYPAGQKPATVAPGEVARVVMTSSQNCSAASTTYGSIELILKSGYPVATHESISSTCGLRYSDWYLEATDLPTTPWDHVTATVETPDEVAAGTTMDFTVTLTNGGDSPAPLDPCPSYKQFVSDGTHTSQGEYGLNCPAMPAELAPGESIRLQMLLDIPAEMRGIPKFAWTLIGTGAHATALFTVTS